MVLRGPFLYLIETPVASLVKGLKRNRGLKMVVIGIGMHVSCSLFVSIMKRDFLYQIYTVVAKGWGKKNLAFFLVVFLANFRRR